MVNKTEKSNALTRAEIKAVKTLVRNRRRVQKKFPLSSALLATAGIILVFSGLTRLINKVEWLTDSPWLMVAVGLFILALTGTLYKKL